MSTLEGLSCACEELKEKLEENVFNPVAPGQFERGKTSFINALLSEKLLPTAVVPLTSIVTTIRYGDPLRVNVHFNNGRVE